MRKPHLTRASPTKVYSTRRVLVPRHRLINLLVLTATLVLIFVTDRWLLARYGNPLWRYDSVLHYEHIPGARFTWGAKYGEKPIHINRHGHYDDEFPVVKPDEELRLLVICDSVVMGHGVAAAEAFSNRLEALLNRRETSHPSHQVINAGVQGYSTLQYLEVLKRSRKFSPDLILVGFTMNDVTEPYRVRKEHGGYGIDYHGILQDASAWRGYLVNQTGFGRWILRLRFGDSNRRARRESISIQAMMAAGPEDEPYAAAWKSAFDDLDRMRELAAEWGIPLVTIVFPYRFQLADAASLRPQTMLTAHAERSGQPIVDLQPLLKQNRERGRVFLDHSHLSVEGHELVANLLLEELIQAGFVDIDRL